MVVNWETSLITLCDEFIKYTDMEITDTNSYSL